MLKLETWGSNELVSNGKDDVPGFKNFSQKKQLTQAVEPGILCFVSWTSE